MTPSQVRPTRIQRFCASALALLLACTTANASMFAGETLDAVANALSWVVLVIVPVVGIAVFWLVHILPEKIAEQKKHPQAKAIQVLCLLSLIFGGMLWPLAWLWAYSKPVLHKMAYGTDVGDEHHGEGAPAEPAGPAAVPVGEEIAALRQQLASLESKIRQEERS